MDLDDSLSLSLYEVRTGIATLSQSEDLFDCFPAINAAFDYTKSFSNQGKEIDENENEEELDNTLVEEEDKNLEYHEFAIFLHALRQYYSYCQVR